MCERRTKIRRYASGALVLIALCTQPLRGQSLQGQAQSPPAPPPSPLDDKRLQLRGLEDGLRASDAERQKIQTDLAAVQAERAKLAQDLIAATAKTQATEARVGEVEKRLDVAKASEDAIRRSLDSRRAVVAEVLAALQRMGRRAPPAVIVSPQDMLQAVRTSMLLGAVVPELRAETEALAADLRDLVRVREAVAAERANLAASLSDLKGDQVSLAKLIETRAATQSQFEAALSTQASRLQDMARQAADLKDLIAKMEGEEARRAAAQSAAEAAANLPLKPDTSRIGPQLAFADTRGSLHLPVSGAILKVFGAPDGFGGSEKGLSIATRPGAIVAAPADAKVVFSGPYRTYGQLLILSTGGGYHLVLAGLDRINVTVGQSVLAGEPVGVMGEGSAKTAAAIAVGVAQPVLYVEFRKDGAAIDPSPWWAKS